MVDQSKIIECAEHFASEAHAGQVRDRTNKPYVQHLKDVFFRLVTLTDITDDILAAALLHDVLEDTSITEKDLRKQFGDEITDMVVRLTNVPSHKSRNARKAQERERIKTSSWAVKCIKLADRTANMEERLRSVWDDTLLRFMPRYVEESRKLLDYSLRGVDTGLEQAYEQALLALDERCVTERWWREQ